MTTSNYVHLLVSVIHPEYEMTTNRYCVGFSLEDQRLRDFDIDRWAEPAQRRKILSMLCEDWLTDGCDVVGCEQIAAALRAAADQSGQINVPFNVVDEWEKIKGTCASFYAAAEWSYKQALKDQRAIAVELDNQGS